VRCTSPFVLNEICKALVVLINPILPFTAQDMYEHMPTYDPNVPCVNQLSWPDVEHLLSVKHMRQFTMRDKLDEVQNFVDKIHHEIFNLQNQKSIVDGNDLDIVFEVKTPDCDEAILLETIEDELEDLLGVSNVEITTSSSIDVRYHL